MSVFRWWLWGLTVWTVVYSGCSLAKPRPAIHYYTLAVNLPEVTPRAATHSLVVRTFSARDPYNQERLVYRSSPYQLDLYDSHRWAALPAEQVADWTRRYLRASGLFARVSPTADGSPDLALSGRIRQFEEVDHEQTWDATLSIDFWLTRTDQRAPLWFQSYAVTQQAAKRNPAAIAEAMSRSLENILGRLVADLTPIVAALPQP
jgi:ABC-type uncharacterized transport system auxiliary subunit